MDDTLVIILTLLFAAIGIFGNSKKRKKPPVKSGSTAAPDSFWDLLLKGESAVPQPAQNDIDEYEEYDEPELLEEKTIKPKTVNKVYDFTPANEGSSDMGHKHAYKTGKKKVLRHNIRKEFSLKKAVIYSEIINRKYS